MKLADTLAKHFGMEDYKGGIEFIYISETAYEEYEVTSINRFGFMWKFKDTGLVGDMRLGSKFFITDAFLKRSVRGGINFRIEVQ